MFNTSFVLSFSLLLSLPLLFLFAPKFLSPKHPHTEISLADELDDLALFRRATLSSLHRPGVVSRLSIPNPKPKIAFLFLINTDLHFAPLWQLFFQNHENLFNVYIHSNPNSKISIDLFKNRFISSKQSKRATPTLISAARRLLATAILDDPLNSYFALVSESCIPLHSFNYVYKSLFKTQIPFPKLSYIEVLANEDTLVDRYNARGDNVMLPELPFEKFRVGSQFFVLSREHSLVVIKDRRMWRKFRLPCLNVDSCYPEEHYFPTLLEMEDPEGVSRYTLTNVNWTDSTDGHPHLYTPQEVLPDLIRKLRESNSSSSYLFARKFTSDCLAPLMDMAKKVIFRDSI